MANFLPANEPIFWTNATRTATGVRDSWAVCFSGIGVAAAFAVGIVTRNPALAAMITAVATLAAAVGYGLFHTQAKSNFYAQMDFLNTRAGNGDESMNPRETALLDKVITFIDKQNARKTDVPAFIPA